MGKSLRLNDKEEKEINEKCIQINKQLVNKNLAPLRDSELVHTILKLSIKNVKLSKEGEIYIDI